MSKRILISLVLGTLILFVWNAISWLGLPLHTSALHDLPEEVVSNAQFKAELPEDGVYHYPGLPADNSDATMAALQEKLAEGPRISLMVYTSGPTGFFAPSQFLVSLLLNFLVVAALLWLLLQLKEKGAATILTVCLVVGLIIVGVSDLAEMNWNLFPLDYTLAYVLDHLVSFALLGLFFGRYTFRGAMT